METLVNKILLEANGIPVFSEEGWTAIMDWLNYFSDDMSKVIPILKKLDVPKQLLYNGKTVYRATSILKKDFKKLLAGGEYTTGSVCSWSKTLYGAEGVANSDFFERPKNSYIVIFQSELNNCILDIEAWATFIKKSKNSQEKKKELSYIESVISDEKEVLFGANKLNKNNILKYLSEEDEGDRDGGYYYDLKGNRL
jgi:hypothetical protein